MSEMNMNNQKSSLSPSDHIPYMYIDTAALRPDYIRANNTKLRPQKKNFYTIFRE